MTDTLQTLLERLENADRPDIKLAHDLALALGAERKEFDVGDGDEEWWLEWPDGERVQNFTASLDSSIELVERVLPGWKWSTRSTNHSMVMRYDIAPIKEYAAYGSTGPISLLTATVQALIAEQE